MDCMTDLQSFSTKNMELQDPDTGDSADNQTDADSLLRIERGWKNKTTQQTINISILLSLRYFKIPAYESLNNQHD